MEPAPFSIVVPIYNEVDAVAGAIAVLAELEPVRRGVCQVVLVDDGSDDGSSDILAEVDLPGFKVIHHRRNRGYGAALKTGVKAAEHPLVVITDADDTYPNHRIPELVGMLEERGLDMLVGARQGAGIPLSRRPAKWVLGKLANYLSGVKIPDLNSGLRVMRKEVVEKFLRILPDGFSFTTTITLLGGNFSATGAPTVTLGVTPLLNVRVLSPTVLIADVPMSTTLGTYNVTVSNPGGQSATLANAFSVVNFDASTVDVEIYHVPHPYVLDIIYASDGNIWGTAGTDDTRIYKLNLSQVVSGTSNGVEVYYEPYSGGTPSTMVEDNDGHICWTQEWFWWAGDGRDGASGGRCGQSVDAKAGIIHRKRSG
jgi:glycosyltransferase involved in cell wall biosynthesis